MSQSDHLCISYFAAHDKIRRLTKEIAGCICPRIADYFTEEHQISDCPPSHLQECWDEEKEYGDSSPERRAAVKSCEVCVKLEELIIERKATRRTLATIKGSICKRGRKLSEQGGES